MRSSRSRTWVQEQVDRLLGPLTGAQRESLATEPREAVSAAFGLPVSIAQEAFGGSPCGLDGIYFDDPPRISVTRTRSSGRMNFTVLHEAGHHLQSLDEELLELYVSLGPDGQLVEEDICDAIAADLLIPAGTVDAVVPGQGPTAADVVSLFERTEASREACCVAAAARLRGPGYVIVADDGGTVRFAAPAGTPYRIARGVAQDSAHPISRAGRIGHARGQARLRHSTGTLTGTMHADAVKDGDYVFAVFTEGRPPWGGLSLLPADGPRGTDVTCPHCGTDFEAYGRPCQRCDDYPCRECHKCGCDVGQAVGAKHCDTCFLEKRADLFPPGSGTCRECSE